MYIYTMSGNIAELFISQVTATPLLEWLAICAAVAEVLLAKSNNVLLYPAGIISTLIYTYLFLRPETKLYADAMLNSYYFVMSILGWIWWTSGKKQIREITSLDLKAWLTLVFCTLLGWGILYALLTIVFPALVAGYTASDVALWDAFVSATAWAGMWLLSRRKLDNWILLNLSNAVAVPLLIYKKMPFTAALTVFLFLVAVKGYYEWKKLMHPQPLPENVNSE